MKIKIPKPIEENLIGMVYTGHIYALTAIAGVAIIGTVLALVGVLTMRTTAKHRGDTA